MASRDTRRRSLPVESTCANSVMGRHLAQAGVGHRTGAARSSRATTANWVVQPSWLSIFLDELADLGPRLPRPARAGYESGTPCARDNRRKPRKSRSTTARRRPTATNSADVFGEQPAADFLSRAAGPPRQSVPRGAGRQRSAICCLGGEKCSSGPYLARTRGLVSCRNAGGSLDHFIGKRKQGWRNFQADTLGGLQIEYERVPCWLLKRQIGRALAPLKIRSISAAERSSDFRQIRAIRHQAAVANQKSRIRRSQVVSWLQQIQTRVLRLSIVSASATIIMPSGKSLFMAANASLKSSGSRNARAPAPKFRSIAPPLPMLHSAASCRGRPLFQSIATF